MRIGHCSDIQFMQLSDRARVDGKLDRILNRKIARKSLGQPRVYATTCDEFGIICAYFLLLFKFYVVIFVRFSMQITVVPHPVKFPKCQIKKVEIP